MAAGWAGVVAGIITLLSIISLATGVSIVGASVWSLLDAALFAVVAWRVWHGSRAWAVTGLALYSLEVIYGVITHPPGVGILTFIVLLALINGVRGTFSLHKYEEMRKQQAMMQAQPQPMAFQAAAPQSYMPTTSVPPPPPPEPPK